MESTQPTNKKEHIKNLLDQICVDQIYLNEALEKSKNQYFMEIENLLPKEPKEGLELEFRSVNNEDSFKRRFSCDDKIGDLKNFAKVKFRKTSDVIIYTKDEGNLLLDKDMTLKDAKLKINEKIIVNDEGF